MEKSEILMHTAHDITIAMDYDALANDTYSCGHDDAGRQNWCHLLILTEAGDITTVSLYGHGTTTPDIWHGRTQVLADIPDGTADIRPLLDAVWSMADDICQIRAKFFVEWDGQNRVGRFDGYSDGEDPLDDICQKLEAAEMPMFFDAWLYLDAWAPDEIAEDIDGHASVDAWAEKIVDDALGIDVYLDRDAVIAVGENAIQDASK